MEPPHGRVDWTSGLLGVSAPRILNPAATTWAAAGLVLAALAVAVWVWIAEWGATEGGLERFPLLWRGLASPLGLWG
jgi:hypothetical protein